MPEGGHLRQFPRQWIQLPLLHRANGTAPLQAGAGWTRNLSEGGACVELDERLPPQTVCSLRFKTERGPIEVEVQVVWAGEPEVGGGTLHGVAFTQSTHGPREILGDLIPLRGQVRESGVRLPIALSVLARLQGQPGLALYGRTGDISHGGFSLRLLQALPPGTALRVTLQTPRGPLTAEGTIVWVEPPEMRRPGEMITHGVRFTSLGWSASLSLGLALAEAA